MPLSSRAAVRRLFEELTDNLDEINLPLIADQVTESVKENPELLAAFLDEHLRPMVYEVGFSVLSSQRASDRRIDAAARAIQAVVLPSTDPPKRVRGRLLAPSPRDRAGFEWLRAPLSLARGRQIRLEAARRHDLALAIGRQDARLEPIRYRTMHYRLIADALPDDDQTVGDTFDDAQIAALWQDAKQRVAAEDRANVLAQQAIAARKQQPALPQP